MPERGPRGPELESEARFSRAVESQDTEDHFARRLDQAVFEDLLRLIRELGEIKNLEEEAVATLDEYRALVPKLEETMLTPQSPDKHAEGPLLEDHLRLIIITLRAIQTGKITLEELPEFNDKLQNMMIDERTSLRTELELMEDLIRLRPQFFEIFAVFHDLAKPDTIGFDAKKGSRGEALGFTKFDNFEARPKKMTLEEETAREHRKQEYYATLYKRYRDLLEGFTKDHLDLLDSPALFQAGFYDEYGITLTHYGHGEVGVEGQNLEGLKKAMEAKGLNEAEQALMIKAVEMHLDPHQRFFPGVDHRKYGDVLKKLEGLPVAPDVAARYLRVGALLDLLGTKVRKEDSLTSEIGPSVNFVLSEVAYNRWLAEDAKRKARDEALKAVGLTAEWLMSLGLTGKAIGDAKRAIETAADGKPLELPTELEAHRAEIEKRLRQSRAT